jgi:hypothetical protein
VCGAMHRFMVLDNLLFQAGGVVTLAWGGLVLNGAIFPALGIYILRLYAITTYTLGGKAV